MPVLFILLTTIAVAGPPSPDQEIVALFDRVCLRGEAPGAGFVAVAAEDVPPDAAGDYIGPHEGRYWRRSGASPAFAARTEGPGHWAGREAHCGVGIAGASFESVALKFANRLGDEAIYRSDGRLATSERGGNTYLTLIGNRADYSVLVTQRPDTWVSLMSGGVVWRSIRR